MWKCSLMPSLITLQDIFHWWCGVLVFSELRPCINLPPLLLRLQWTFYSYKRSSHYYAKDKKLSLYIYHPFFIFYFVHLNFQLSSNEFVFCLYGCVTGMFYCKYQSCELFVNLKMLFLYIFASNSYLFL